MPHTTHANATLTPAGRLALARCVVHDQWPLRRTAERFQVSHTTARRWASRYREHGPAGMHDRPSRPARCPRRTPPATGGAVRSGRSRAARTAPVTTGRGHDPRPRSAAPPPSADRALPSPAHRACEAP
jgi:hypothetical protein